MKQRGCFVFRAASGITYHGTKTGTGPHLLFLHGFTGHKTAYPSLLNQLTRVCTVTSLDLPGHGHTAIPANALGGFMQVVADLAQILAARALDPAHCVGYSMGGRIVLAMALQFPKLVQSLTLIGASPGIASQALRLRRQAKDRDLAAFIAAVPIAAFLDYWHRLPLFAHGKPVSPESHRGSPCPPGQASNLARSLSMLGTGVQPSFWDVLSELQVPVQLIVGRNDAKYVQVARDMQRRLPNSRMDLISAAGHRAHVDQPEEVGAKLMEHVLQHPGEQHQK